MNETAEANMPSQSSVSSGSSDEPTPGPTPDPGPTPGPFKQVCYINLQHLMLPIDEVEAMYNAMILTLDGNTLIVSGDTILAPRAVYYGDVSTTGFVAVDGTSDPKCSKLMDIMMDEDNTAPISYTDGENGEKIATIETEGKDNITFISAEL